MSDQSQTLKQGTLWDFGGAADLCAAGVGAPHIRQRLFWVAYAGHEQSRRSPTTGKEEIGRAFSESSGRRDAGRLGESTGQRLEGGAVEAAHPQLSPAERAGPWSDCELIPCADGKKRRVESGIQCLVAGVAFRLADGRAREDVSRAALLRCVGNSIAPQVAAEFVSVFLELSWQNKPSART